jgi:PUA-domain protein
VLVETVQPSTYAASPFELNKNHFVQALFEDLRGNFRHSQLNRTRVCGFGRRYAFKDSLSRRFRKVLTDRTILKDRDAKPLIEDLRRLPNQQNLTHKARVEIETVKDAEIIFVDGVPIAFRKKGELIPVLTNKVALDSMPRIVVDMGAVPHVAGGADIMAPGIRSISESVLEKNLVVVVDEKHGKYLAVGKALLDAGLMRTTKHGKVVSNVHYVGDPIWESIKPKGPGS